MVKYEYKGNFLTIGELMEFSSVKEITLRTRLLRGWRVLDALTLKPFSDKRGLRNDFDTRSNSQLLKKGEMKRSIEDLIEKRLFDKELKDF